MTESRGSAPTQMPPRGGSGYDTGNSGGNSKPPMSGKSGSSGESMAELGKQGQEAISQAQEQAVKLVGQAREQATTQVTTQKERAAGLLGALGTALHDASGEVRKQDETAMADFIDMTAGQVDNVARMLKEQDLGQLVETTQQFARKQPMMFLAAAVAVGIVGARFLKSSSQSGGQEQSAAKPEMPSYGSSIASGGPGAGRL